MAIRFFLFDWWHCSMIKWQYSITMGSPSSVQSFSPAFLQLKLWTDELEYIKCPCSCNVHD